VKFDDHSQSVLVVDDDAEVRAVTADLLEEGGYLAIGAASAEEALEVLHSGVRPIALLIDLHLPGMNGESFCQACAADPRFSTIARIIVSGHGDAKARMKGCDALKLLHKPLYWPALLDTLHRIDAEY
jgi:CheY-like chemotaxis protein